MEKVYLLRHSDDGTESMGVLNATNKRGDMTAVTLELPYLENKQDISCIPTGAYPCKWTRSNRLSNVAGYDVFTYEVLNVPNRAGIRIHSANFFSQLLGCIALGDDLIDLNKDGHEDAANSRATVKKFNEIMGGEDFELEISNAFSI